MISIDMFYVRFLDSYQFLNASLETLVSDLVKLCQFQLLFKRTRHHFKDLDSELLFAKGVFPYEYFDSFDKFDETALPPKEAFYSTLKEAISD